MQGVGLTSIWIQTPIATVGADVLHGIATTSEHFRNNTTMTTKTAFITGITGQDGSYLAEHLLTLG